MMQAPRVSVVVATHNRAERLETLLGSLRQQTLPAAVFEVVVVDDGSRDETAEVLSRERARGDLQMTVLRNAAAGGPAAARNAGLRAARAPVVAFVDDDCVALPRWLEAGVEALEANPNAIVQGPVVPNPAEAHLIGPFARSVNVKSLTPYFQAGNVFYPRSLLDRVDGFDEVGFAARGEDSDLGWRAVAAGGVPIFVEEAAVYHAVIVLGPLGRLRHESRWGTIVKAYARHPELRRADLDRRFFWRGHYLLVRALVALFLPRRVAGVSLLPLRRWLALPYLRQLWRRRGLERARTLQLPYLVLCDLVELYAIGRAAIRYRTPML